MGVAGWLVAAAGTISFAVAALLLGRIPGVFRVAEADRQGERERLRDRLTEGAHVLWRDPLLRRLTLFTAAMNVWWAAFTALFVVYAVDPGPMDLAAPEYGLLLTAMAIGGLAGSMGASRVVQRLGLRTALALDLAGTAVLLGVPALTTEPLLVGAAVAVAGFGASVWVVVVGSLRQTLVPERLLGRVYSASRLVSWGVLPLGAAAGGALAELVGVRTVFAIGAVASAGLLVAFLRSVSSADLRRGAPG
jgi:predicted MFS family arabinose efflux permease